MRKPGVARRKCVIAITAASTALPDCSDLFLNVLRNNSRCVWSTGELMIGKGNQNIRRGIYNKFLVHCCRISLCSRSHARLTQCSHTSGCLRDGDDATDLQHFDDRVQVPVERVQCLLDAGEFILWQFVVAARRLDELPAGTEQRHRRDFSYEDVACV